MRGKITHLKQIWTNTGGWDQSVVPGLLLQGGTYQSTAVNCVFVYDCTVNHKHVASHSQMSLKNEMFPQIEWYGILSTYVSGCRTGISSQRQPHPPSVHHLTLIHAQLQEVQPLHT